MNQILQNAVFDLTGDHNHIVAECQALNDNSVKIRTRINHSPSTFYWGLQPSTSGDASVISVYNAPKGQDDIHVMFDYPVNREERSGWISANYDLVFPFATVNLKIPNTSISFPLNKNLSKFNLMFPASNYTTQAVQIEGTTVNTDNQVVLNATINTTQAYTARWLNPSSVEIAATDNVMLHNPPSGVYTFELTLASGCVLINTITI